MPKAVATEGPVREAVGVFDDAKSLQSVFDELLVSGQFRRDDISLLATDKAIEEKLGYKPKTSEEAAEDPAAPRTIPIMPEEVGNAKGMMIGGFLYLGAIGAAGAVVGTGGTLAALIGAAAAGGGVGATVGGGLSRWLDRKHAERLQDQIERGALVLWVRTADESQEQAALDILKKHGAEDAHIHELEEVEVDK